MGLDHCMHGVFGYVFHVCDCVIVCYTFRGKLIHGMMYMGAGKLYAWHIVYRKKWNAKVRNYNLRGSKN